MGYTESEYAKTLDVSYEFEEESASEDIWQKIKKTSPTQDSTQ